ncbi:MAG: peptidoglycan editing factor PgeF [Anaerolineae bacterium]|nr:peptidoglycan editing factor PgeF [Anaerolineae bacterium]
MKRIQQDSLEFYQSEMWTQLKHGIFTRNGGVSLSPWASLNTGGTVGDDVAAVKRNHELMYEALDVEQKNACTTWQVHGADVVIANGPVQNRKWVARADGVITNRVDVPLVMRYADCVPLLFHDPIQKAIGLSHAGWRGTVQGMASNTVLALQQAYGSRPQDVQVIIGPSISLECFQVGDEVLAAVEDYFGTLDGLMQRDPNDGTAYVDLWAANKLDLERAGVEQIEIANICTYQNTHDFFSHRAEKGKTGRFGVVMSL